jgi:hypothetical protein
MQARGAGGTARPSFSVQAKVQEARWPLPSARAVQPPPLPYVLKVGGMRGSVLAKL